MFTEKVLITNPTGLHARPAGQLAQLCAKMPVEIQLITEGKEINPKGVIAILTAGMKQGTEITVQTEGEDEALYGHQIIEFIQNLTE